MSSLSSIKLGTSLYLLILSLLSGILIAFHIGFPTINNANDLLLILLLSTSIIVIIDFVILLPPNGSGLSMDSAIYLAAIFYFGVEYTLIVLIISSILSIIQKRKTAVWKHIFNFSMFSTIIIFSYHIFIWTGGRVGSLNLAFIHSYVFSLLMYLLLNVLFIAFFYRFNSLDSSFTIIRNILKESVSNYFIILLAALMLIILLETYPIFGLIIFTIIIILISNALRKYHLMYEEVSIDRKFREQIMNSVPVGIATYDYRTTEYILNTTAKQILKIETNSIKNSIHSGENKEFWNLFASKNNIYNKKTNYSKDGHHYQLLVSQADLIDQYNIPIGKIFSFIDITEIEELEKRIYQSEKLALLGEISAKAAHEIRNPLTVIYGFLTLMKQSFSSTEKERYRIPLMMNEFERINSIIDEMLSLAKPKKPVLVESNIEEVVEDVLALYKQTSPQNIQFDVELDHVPLMIDKHQITQVLYNLIRNSSEAIECASGEISIYSQVTDNQYLIFIKDNGSGIPLELQKTIFEPFLTSKDSGTGLGLTIVQRIIENHGGTIELYESSEEGTTFIIHLPVKKEAYLT